MIIFVFFDLENQPVYAQILHEVGLVVESWLVIDLVEGLVDQSERVGAQLYVQHILMKSIYMRIKKLPILSSTTIFQKRTCN